MPLIVLTGLPATGKTRRADALRAWLEADGHTVHVVNDEALGLDRRAAYADGAAEKAARGALLAAVERVLSKDAVTIADGLNYIKGFRYQLHCAARALGTPHAVLECVASPEQRHAWNHARADGYPDALADALASRYEPPNPMLRWDRPHWVLAPDDPLPTTALAAALFVGRAPARNLATRSMPLASPNYLFELDRATQAVLARIAEAQAAAGAAGIDVTVVVEGATVQVPHTATPAELQRHRQQFVRLNRLNELKALEGVSVLFAQYLATVLAAPAPLP